MTSLLNVKLLSQRSKDMKGKVALYSVIKNMKDSFFVYLC